MLRQYGFLDILYVCIIIAILLCGNYRKIISDYEENTGIQDWAQIGNQDKVEQQVNLIQNPYEVMEYQIGIFYRAENVKAEDWMEIYLQGQSAQYEMQCDFRIEQGTQQIEIKLPDGLNTGMYQLSVVPHIDSMTRLEIGVSQGRLNLKNAIVNAVDKNRHLALTMHYHIFELEKGKIICRNIVICILVIMVLAAIVCLYQNKGKYRVFVCSFTIIFMYIILSYFELFFDSVPFIEDGALFAESARNENLLKQLLVKDAGYLCIIQHLAAWFCVRVLSLGHRAYLGMNLIAILFISLMDSLINLPVFQKVADRKTRFLISICIPVLFARQYESYAFINFIYWGIILILLTLFVDLDALERRTYIGTLFLEVLICLSKGIYAVLFPVIFLYLFMLLVIGGCSKRKVFFWLCIGIAGMIQCICYMSAGSRAVEPIGMSMQLIMRVFMQTGRMVLGITPLLTSQSNEIVLAGLGVFVCLCGVLKFIRGLMTKKIKHVFLTIFIALGVCNSFMVEINVYYDKTEMALWYSRQEFFSIVVYIFAIMIIVTEIKKYRDVINFGLLFLIGLLCVRLFWIGNTNWVKTPNTFDFSVAKIDTLDWDIYGSYWDGEHYFVKIMPAFFSLSRNVSEDYYSAGIENPFLGVNSENYENSSIPCSFIPNQNVNKIDVAEGTKLWGIYFVKNGISNQYEVQGYDCFGDLLCYEAQLDSCNEKGCIIKFDEAVENVSYLVFRDMISDRYIDILPEYVVVTMK